MLRMEENMRRDRSDVFAGLWANCEYEQMQEKEEKLIAHVCWSSSRRWPPKCTSIGTTKKVASWPQSLEFLIWIHCSCSICSMGVESWQTAWCRCKWSPEIHFSTKMLQVRGLTRDSHQDKFQQAGYSQNRIKQPQSENSFGHLSSLHVGLKCWLEALDSKITPKSSSTSSCPLQRMKTVTNFSPSCMVIVEWSLKVSLVWSC